MAGSPLASSQIAERQGRCQRATAFLTQKNITPRTNSDRKVPMAKNVSPSPQK